MLSFELSFVWLILFTEIQFQLLRGDSLSLFVTGV